MSIKEIVELIEMTKSLKLITQAFTSIASSKLKNIRNRVERNREFFDELTGIYNIVNQIAVYRHVKRPVKSKKIATIVLTSNYRFYGTVTGNLIKFYIDQTKDLDVERIFLGVTFQDYLKALNYNKPYRMIIQKSDFPTEIELKNLTDLVKDYEQVLVYYPLFKSVLVQVPAVKDITQAVRDINSTEEQRTKARQINLSYILEPEIIEIASFFDAQIKNLLLEQTFLEAELARTASRLVTMDGAQTEANNQMGGFKRELFVAKRSLTNARILETISSLKNQQSNKI